ncbi:hypothetical protein DXG01_005389 [Tephrocybe rancida]|nr:hypothetical protein DXG01_005389 [Tephrocybe rancida]
MPSFRSICLIAATAFAAFASASPIAGGVTQGVQVIGLNNDLNNALQNVDVKDVDVDVLNVRRELVEPAVEARAVQALPDIFKSAHEKLLVIKAEVDIIVHGGKKVDVDTVRPIIVKIGAIIAEVVVSVKLLHGAPLNVILGVVAVVDVGGLLAAVLIVVAEILTALLGCVVAADVHIVVAIIAGTIDGVLCELLDLVVGLVGGLLAIVLGLLGGVLHLLGGCGLNGVLAILLKVVIVL